MASSPDSLEEILSCQVCFEEFEEDGDHVPRILPCSHTLCHTCVGRLIRGIRIECPECRVKHEATKEEKSFPQNKYILVQMKRRTPRLQRDQSPTEKCREHGKELNIFCKELGCQRAICLSCLSQGHKKHEFVEIEERRKEAIDILRKNIKAVTDNLERKIQKITKAKENVAEKLENKLEELNIKKGEMMKQYDTMIKDTENQMKQINIKTNRDLNTMKENLNVLHDMNKSAEGVTYRDVVNKLDTVSSITENVNKHLTGTRTYKYHEYITNIETQTTRKEIVVDIKEEITEESLETNGTKNYAEKQINPARLRGRQIKLTEMQTDYTSINHLTLLSDGTVAACEGQRLTRYDLETGRTINSTELEFWLFGISEVKLRSKSALVLSYFKRLEFCDPNNLQTSIYTLSVAPHQPFTLCVAPPSTLFYVDYQSGRPSNIHRLDCSGATPTLCQSIGPYDHIISSMAYIKYINENLLAIVVDKELQTFQIDTGLVKWGKKDIQLPGQNDNFKPFYMAADRKGHLFVSDDNKCIQMFSASDGQYLGCLIKEGEQGLGKLGQMCFSESTSQLVVSHRKDGKIFITVLNVE